MAQKTFDPFGDEEELIAPTAVIPSADELERINRAQRQFLVHSFLYYKLDENVISDGEYDKLCDDLIALMKQPEAIRSKYYGICLTALDESKSGYSIDKYPPETITSAMHVLYRHKQVFKELTFKQFVSKYGYGVEAQL